MDTKLNVQIIHIYLKGTQDAMYEWTVHEAFQYLLTRALNAERLCTCYSFRALDNNTWRTCSISLNDLPVTSKIKGFASSPRTSYIHSCALGIMLVLPPEAISMHTTLQTGAEFLDTHRLCQLGAGPHCLKTNG